MTDLATLVPPLVLQQLTSEEQAYLSQVFTRFNGYPSLEEVWKLMDEQWLAFGCDPEQMDERVTAFYRHPVWMLNGLFIEQHAQSLKNRQVFTDWVVQQRPARLADFGGGFGGLARFVGQALPAAEVEVVDPHPHPAAIAVAANTLNVRFVPELSGEYDLLIATDVFEHVPDPIGLAAETAAHLRVGGQYLIANCFQPVILCHLPQNLHLRHSWDRALEAMGLQAAEQVAYGSLFVSPGTLHLDAARQIERRSRQMWTITKYLPSRIGKPLSKSLY